MLVGTGVTYYIEIMERSNLIPLRILRLRSLARGFHARSLVRLQ